jgi:nucleoside-diphosphate-sugar epimerase
MTRVLVTGGAGYVGSVLTPILLSRGYQVRVLDNLMYRQPSLLPYFRYGELEFVRGDVRDSTTLKDSLNDVDHVIHLAAIVGAPACARDPRLAEEVNYESTAVLSQLRSPSQGVIFASTGSNYGAVEDVCTEDTPLNPLSVYGVTKTKAETVLLDGGNAVVYRFATAFGLSSRLRLDLLVNDFVFQALKNRRIVIYEQGFRRTFIHVHDMARALLHAVENYDKMEGEAYNVGHEGLNHTKEEVALAIQRKVDYQLEYADVGSDPDKRDYEVSYAKVRKTGFTTAVSLEEGIDELIRGCEMITLQNPYSNIES